VSVSVEDFFVSFFDGIQGFKASRADAPRLKYHKTLYTDGIVSFNDEIFTVFEFKKVQLNFQQIMSFFLTKKKMLFMHRQLNTYYAQIRKSLLQNLNLIKSYFLTALKL